MSNQRWFIVEPLFKTLDHATPKSIQRLASARHPHLKISIADPRQNARPQPKAAPLLGHSLERRPNNKTTSVCCTHHLGNAGISKQKILTQCRPIAGPSSTSKRETSSTEAAKPKAKGDIPLPLCWQRN